MERMAWSCLLVVEKRTNEKLAWFPWRAAFYWNIKCAHISVMYISVNIITRTGVLIVVELNAIFPGKEIYTFMIQNLVVSSNKTCFFFWAKTLLAVLSTWAQIFIFIGKVHGIHYGGRASTECSCNGIPVDCILGKMWLLRNLRYIRT